MKITMIKLGLLAAAVVVIAFSGCCAPMQRASLSELGAFADKVKAQATRDYEAGNLPQSESLARQFQADKAKQLVDAMLAEVE